MQGGSERGAEVTIRAVVLGVLLGLVFAAANAYLGLRVGMTVATSIPAVIMTVAITRALGRPAGILEATMSQCIGSSSTSLATGAIFTLPALYLWGVPPSFMQIVLIALLGGVLGTAAMIPLRRVLIVDSAAELPYPEGRAAADVLQAATRGLPGAAWIFRGLAIGIGLKLLVAIVGLIPSEVGGALPWLPSVAISLELAPALFGVGYILGNRRASVLVGGSALAALLLAPVLALGFPNLHSPSLPGTAGTMTADELWRGFLRYIGAGAVALAGLGTVVAGLPSMARAFSAVAGGLGKRAAAVATSERDLPPQVVIGCLTAVFVTVAFVPNVLGDSIGGGQRIATALGVAVFGVIFVAVMARIAGIVGTSSQPTSGVTIVTVLTIGGAFALLGWTMPAHKVAVLCAGAVVAIAASSSGEMAQDLKTAHLVGATPAWQQLGQLLGVATSCWVVALTLRFLADAYGFGTKELAAPQATLIRTLIEGVLAGGLPWKLLAVGAAIAVVPAALRIGALGFAVGLYLPLASMLPIFLGGLARWWSARARTEGEPSEPEGVDGGVLLASGLVAGEGLAGVAVAAVRGGLGLGQVDPLVPSWVSGGLGVACAIAVLGLLIRAGKRPGLDHPVDGRS
jgi:putative OPT family oligopeptide transporter